MILSEQRPIHPQVRRRRPTHARRSSPVVCIAVRSSVALCLVGTLLGVFAVTASAKDSYPCGPAQSAPWTTMRVQSCPLTTPLPPNGWIPVYAHAGGPLVGWLHGTAGQLFVCQSLSSVTYHHPNTSWYNNWWAKTLSDDNHWGWVPEVYFRGGENDERDAGLAICPSVTPGPAPQPAPKPAPKPAPAPAPKPKPAPGPKPAPAPAPPPLALPPAPAPPRASQCSLAAAPSTSHTTKVSARVAPMGARGHRGSRIVAGYGRRLQITGRVTRADGSPMAGSAVCVMSGPLAGAGTPQLVTTLTTGLSGRFSYVWDASATRRFWLVDHGIGGAAEARVTIRVRPSVALHGSRRTLRNGHSLVLEGRVRSRPLPAGLLIDLQALVAAHRWQTFAETHALGDGRFSYTYMFTRTVGRQVYALRAHVPRQIGYPFVAGASRAIHVVVTG
jgi:hypothetical protein